ncbi:hypothetical protein BH10ACT1_BH10ACT1_04920 [soil metagenome]
MKRWTKAISGTTVAVALALGGTMGPASAATSRYSVSESGIKDGNPSSVDNGWYREDTRPGGSVSVTRHLTSASDGFSGPAGFGDGALAITTNNSNYAKAQVMNHSLQGKSLSTVTALDYWTFQSSETGSVNDAASLQLRVDVDGDLTTTADQTNLVYEPYWNDTEGTDPQSALAPDVWQHWEATGGDWWSSKQITCGAFSLAPGAGGPPFSRPSAVAEACPTAKVVAFGVNAGSYNRNYVVAVDGLHISTTTDDFTYDFGPK